MTFSGCLPCVFGFTVTAGFTVPGSRAAAVLMRRFWSAVICLDRKTLSGQRWEITESFWGRRPSCDPRFLCWQAGRPAVEPRGGTRPLRLLSSVQQIVFGVCRCKPSVKFWMETQIRCVVLILGAWRAPDLPGDASLLVSLLEKFKCEDTDRKKQQLLGSSSCFLFQEESLSQSFFVSHMKNRFYMIHMNIFTHQGPNICVHLSHAPTRTYHMYIYTEYIVYI